MSIHPVRCPHDNIVGICDLCTIRFFREKYWIDGWALDAYTDRNGTTLLGKLVHDIKYVDHNNPQTASEKSEQLFITLDKFIKKMYPMRQRPFDCLLYPPSNTKRVFHLTQYLANSLANQALSNRSDEVVKVKSLSTVKAIPRKERSQTLRGAIKIEPNTSKPKPKGILIIDDVLETGSTVKELCRALEEVWPQVQVPRYYVALTYLIDW